MTTGAHISAHAVAERFEGFGEVAFAQLEAAPLITPGVCFQPECGRMFEPGRGWQIYCSEACRAKGTAEARKWGHRAALPLLVHRIGSKSKDEAVRERTRVARNFVWRLQSAWLADRVQRQGER
ncbi:MAG: hypothetical protein KJ731_01790 [Alphaproteobacteria bacterium]|nr:hypothetical protein [Alphaproteobacteria bacterium]MBU1280278.1 hypothetical protein [Alphaproteobacteria bacterium]MBU1573017.1 hypothetical protein [Alphaproteobacteria bacterium]MBU1827200.1 hypothetical protein [Alphaproteobacteria bacterium]MBU2079976.1 hypothetical protein [Alphaproteobacteria bacterium]